MNKVLDAKSTFGTAVALDGEDALDAGDAYAGLAVLPYAQVIPGGLITHKVEDGTERKYLKATVTLTPDRTGANEASQYRLHSWPRNIIAAVSEGFAANDGSRAPWTIPIQIVPAVYVQYANGVAKPTPLCGLEPVTVIAEARLLREAYEQFPAEVTTAVTVWSRSIAGDGDSSSTVWEALGNRIADVLDAKSTAPGNLSTSKEQNYVEPKFGEDGQITQNADPLRNIEVDSVLTVRHSDLALSLEYQRVEELLNSVKEATNGPGARRDAELAALKIARDKQEAQEPPEPAPADYKDRADLDQKAYVKEQILKLRKKEHARLYNVLSGQRDAAKTAYTGEVNAQAVDTCTVRDYSDAWKDRDVFTSGNDGRKAFDAAADAQAYATWPQHETQVENGWARRLLTGLDEKAERAAQSFFTIQSTPSVSRLFGLSIDVEIPLDLPPSEPDGPERSLLGMLAKFAALGNCPVASPDRPEGFVFVSTSLGCDAASRANTELSRALPWTLAKLRLCDDDHFWPATEEELWASAYGTCGPENLSQYEGHLIMGSGFDLSAEKATASRFDLTSMDIRGGTELEKQRRLSRQTNVDSTISAPAEAAPGEDQSPDHTAAERPPPAEDAAYWADLAHASTLQTTGLTLLDRGIQQQAVAKLHAKSAKADASATGGDYCGFAVLSPTAGCPKGHVVLDAEDLTVGVRLDVGVPLTNGNTDWHSLTSRIIDFGTSGVRAETLLNKCLPQLTGGFGEDYRVGLDSALQSTPARMLPNGSEPTAAKVEVMMDEAFVHWDGAPMGIDTNHAVDESGHALKSEDALVFGRTLSLPVSDGKIDRQYLPVPLQYGRPYRFKLRNVYQSGLSVDARASETANSKMGGKVFYPPGPNTGGPYVPFFRFLRQHRIDRPVVLLEADTATRNNSPMATENGPEMIVRSIAPGSKSISSGHARPGRTRRVIVPPSVPLEEASRHGVFNDIDPETIEDDPPGVLRTASHDVGGDFPVVATKTRKGFNELRHFVSRSIAPRAGVKTPDLEYGSPVLTPADAKGPRGEYYADPAAEHLAFGIRLPRHETYLGNGWAEETFCIEIGHRKDYSDFMPLVIELIADDDPVGRVRPRINQILELKPDTPISGLKQRARYLRARLRPGEAFELDVWCVPSAATLARDFSLVQSLAIYCAKTIEQSATCTVDQVLAGLRVIAPELAERIAAEIAAELCDVTRSYVGPGGVIAPPTEVLKGIARVLHKILKTRPLPELSAKTTLVIEHATNKPATPPALWQAASTVPTPSIGSISPELRVLRPSAEAILAAGRVAATGDVVDLSPDDAAIAEQSTAFVLDGDIGLSLDTVDAFELVARTVFPGTTKFDDRNRKRSLARKREGSWPETAASDGTLSLRASRDLFGFDVFEDGHVEHTTQEFSLLRVESLPTRLQAPADGTLDVERLRYFFLSDLAHDRQTNPDHSAGPHPTGAEGPQKWRTVYRHAFPDGKARRLRVTPRVMSRTVGQMETMRMVTNDVLVPSKPIPIDQSYTEGAPVDVVLPATVRPAAVKSLSPLQAFRWDDVTPEWKKGVIGMRRRSVVRLPLGREWFSSGDGERVGLVVWPPRLTFADTASVNADIVPFTRAGEQERTHADLFDFMDEDLGPGGQFITRLGADPTREQPRDPRDQSSGEYKIRPGVFLPLTAFRDLVEPRDEHRRAEYAQAVLMPAEEISKAKGTGPTDGHVSKNQMLTVGLVHYEPLFDPEAEQWFIDVSIDALGLPDPFVRFGLVRYQPNTIPELQVSRPVVQWANLMPWREVEASIVGDDVRVSVTGPTSLGAKNIGKRTNLDSPRMRFHLFREYMSNDGYVEQVPIELEKDRQPDEGIAPSWRPPESDAEPDARTLYARWDLPLDRKTLQADDGGIVALYIEEIEWRRPAQYPVEPLSRKQLDDYDIFLESGPRFAARLDLTNLSIEVK